MPVMPGYVHADVPHEMTVVGDAYRYGCNSVRIGDIRPRGKTTTYVASVWATPQPVTTEWLPMRCGHSLRYADPACDGCANRNQ